MCMRLPNVMDIELMNIILDGVEWNYEKNKE